jgi:hypothetical protein
MCWSNIRSRFSRSSRFSSFRTVSRRVPEREGEKERKQGKQTNKKLLRPVDRSCPTQKHWATQIRAATILILLRNCLLKSESCCFLLATMESRNSGGKGSFFCHQSSVSSLRCLQRTASTSMSNICHVTLVKLQGRSWTRRWTSSFSSAVNVRGWPPGHRSKVRSAPPPSR